MSDFRLIEIEGVIHQIHCIGNEPLTWWSPNQNLVNRSRTFDIVHFSIQIGEHQLEGYFTQLVFNLGSKVNVVALDQDDGEKPQILALCTEHQILHINPFINNRCSRVHGNQNIPQWIYSIALVVILMSWLYFRSWGGILYGLFIGFAVLVCVAFTWMCYTETKIDHDFTKLRKHLFATEIMTNIHQGQIYKDCYWYRMKEFIIDLNLLGK